MFRLTALALAVVLMAPVAGVFAPAGSPGDSPFVQAQDKKDTKKKKKDGSSSQPAPTGKKDGY
jgi:hypothetical protein